MKLTGTDSELSLPYPTRPLGTAGPVSALEALERQFRGRAQDYAMVSSMGAWTYGELDLRVESVARELDLLGVRSGDLVAIHAARHPYLAPAALGVWRLGAAFVMVDAAHPGVSLIGRLSQLPLRACLDVAPGMNSSLAAHLSAQGVSRLDPRLLAPSTMREDRAVPDGGAAAYVAFTSGSTGTPRGVLGTHGPVAHFVEWHARRFKLDQSERFALTSGLGHDPLLRDMLTPLATGACLFVPDDETLRDGRAFANWVRDHGITVLHLTPTLAQMLLIGAESSQPPLTSLRYLFFGGEALTQKLADRCVAVAPQATVVNYYGATETPQVMGHHVYDPDEALPGGLVPVGQGIEDVQLLVITQDGQLARLGEHGEIYIRTPHLAAGYWGDQAATSERFVCNPLTGQPADRVYRTGDLGYYWKGQSVMLIGRIDNQLKISGHRIEPGEVEATLERHPRIRQAVVVAHHGNLGPELYAYCVVTPGEPVSVRQVRAFTASVLPGYMRPARIFFLPAIPMTPNGKVDRAALAQLPAPVRKESASEELQVEDGCESQLEKSLGGLWAEALEMDRAGRDDDFFELGGSSLQAAILINAIEITLGTQAPLAMLLEARTPARFAIALERSDPAMRWQSLVRMAGGRTDHEILFCVHAVGGNVLTYRALAEALDPHPVYALQAVGLDGRAEPDPNIPAMAERYVGELRRVQPNGPYHLCGFSAGGLIAMEMASRLVNDGQSVAVVILFDSRIVAEDWMAAVWARKVVRNIKAFASLEGGARRAFLRTKWTNAGRNLDVIRVAVGWRNRPQTSRGFAAMRRVEAGIRLAELSYRPQQYSGRVVLFRTHTGTAANPALLEKSWRSVVPQGLEIVEAAGTHEEMLPEYSTVLAAQVRRVLRPD